jgi:hypothetical protein
VVAQMPPLQGLLRSAPLGAAVLCVLVGGAVAVAAKVPACPGGRFLPDAALVTDSAAADAVELDGTTRRLTIGTSCGPGRAKLRGTRKGTRVQGKVRCTGVKKPARLRALVQPDCNRLVGTMRLGGRTVPVNATRSTGCGDGLVDPGLGEACEADGGCPAGQRCAGCRCVPAATASTSSTVVSTTTSSTLRPPSTLPGATSTTTTSSVVTTTLSTTTTAPVPGCGDGTCGPGEDPLSCPGDCSCLRDLGATVLDACTNLEWEKKDAADGLVDATNLHDADNRYVWAGQCDNDPVLRLCQPNAAAAAACTALSDGVGDKNGCAVCPAEFPNCKVVAGGFGTPAVTTVWDWLVQLNAAEGEGGWRLPSEGQRATPQTSSLRELESIARPPLVDCPPCVEPPLLPQPHRFYHSSTGASATTAVLGDFGTGGAAFFNKTSAHGVRAVRTPAP